jgi:DNA-binding response OmpR family regulator
VLKLLIVEDDSQLATTLKYLVEDNPRYRVMAIASDAEAAVAAAAEHQPDLALLDLQLAHGTSGFSVAVHLGELDVPCLFVTGKPPGFPMPDLAMGCLMKPFTAEEVHRAIGLAEDRLRGREALRQRPPRNFTVYEEPEAPTTSCAEPAPLAGVIPSKLSLRTRLEHWISGHAS